MEKWLPLAVALLVAFGCATQERAPEAAGAKNACISECRREILSGRNLSDGPCLLDTMPDYPGWVCDVAHSPRQAVDDLPANQCGSFAKGKASHFIEVTPDCIFIREY